MGFDLGEGWQVQDCALVITPAPSKLGAAIMHAGGGVTVWTKEAIRF
jgi:hypothetical protein